MPDMRHTLDLSSKKYFCPNCGKKTFVVVIDQNRNVVDEKKFGRCDREDSCGYFKKPSDSEAGSTVEYFQNRETKILSDYVFKANEVNALVNNYEKNNLFKFISTKFDKEKVRYIFEIYRVGIYSGLSNFDWNVFWQIDGKGWVRTGKIIKYGVDGKRDKSTNPMWYHSLKENKKEDYKPNQCLFGYHLKGLGHPIAVVESEKTALICSLFIPNYTWMATGGKSNFRLLKDLKNCDVTLFADLGAFEDWKKVADDYKIKISTYLEKIATQEDRKNGYDLADFLMR